MDELTEDRERAVAAEVLEQDDRHAAELLSVRRTDGVEDLLVVDARLAVGRARQHVGGVTDEQRAAVDLGDTEEATLDRARRLVAHPNVIDAMPVRGSGFTQGSTASHSGQA